MEFLCKFLKNDVITCKRVVTKVNLISYVGRTDKNGLKLLECTNMEKSIHANAFFN